MPVGRIGMGMDAAGWTFSAMVDAGCECSAAFKRQWRDGRQLRGCALVLCASLAENGVCGYIRGLLREGETDS
jgi:hypothetical protein